MGRYPLDTDISSYIMKRWNAAVIERLQAVPINTVAISIITKSELLYGVELSPRRQQDSLALKAYLRHIEVLDFADEAAEHYTNIRGFLKNSSVMIGANDLLIAAHARSLQRILVTNNMREFGRVPHLQIENWAL
jgi:tRNA(fMet)-specific endonuclease VapC